LLAALGEDVRSLLATIAEISEKIKVAVRARRDLEKPGGINIGKVNINPFKKKGTLVGINKKDKDVGELLFLQRIREMKVACLNINIAANLYASIINDVITYGFQEAIRFSYDNLGESSPSRIEAKRKEMMGKWHKEARRICSAKNDEAKRTLEMRLQSMGTPPPAYSAPHQPQGFPTQPYPPQGYSQQPYPPQGYDPRQYPQQGFAPHPFPQGYPPQSFGYPPQTYPPQMFPTAGQGFQTDDGVFVMSPSGRPRQAFEV
jgi:hypothetical protein